MKLILSQRIFQILLIVTLFSFWAIFALLVVNKVFFQDLPGYTVGKLCIWEVVAMAAAVIVSNVMIRRWGNIEYYENSNQTRLVIPAEYGIYFSIYFLIAIIISIWQFVIFSAQF